MAGFLLFIFTLLHRHATKHGHAFISLTAAHGSIHTDTAGRAIAAGLGGITEPVIRHTLVNADAVVAEVALGAIAKGILRTAFIGEGRTAHIAGTIAIAELTVGTDRRAHQIALPGITVALQGIAFAEAGVQTTIRALLTGIAGHTHLPTGAGRIAAFSAGVGRVAAGAFGAGGHTGVFAKTGYTVAEACGASSDLTAVPAETGSAVANIGKYAYAGIVKAVHQRITGIGIFVTLGVFRAFGAIGTGEAEPGAQIVLQHTVFVGCRAGGFAFRIANLNATVIVQTHKIYLAGQIRVTGIANVATGGIAAQAYAPAGSVEVAVSDFQGQMAELVTGASGAFGGRLTNFAADIFETGKTAVALRGIHTGFALGTATVIHGISRIFFGDSIVFGHIAVNIAVGINIAIGKRLGLAGSGTGAEVAEFICATLGIGAAHGFALPKDTGLTGGTATATGIGGNAAHALIRVAVLAQGTFFVHRAGNSGLAFAHVIAQHTPVTVRIQDTAVVLIVFFVLFSTTAQHQRSKEEYRHRQQGNNNRMVYVTRIFHDHETLLS